MEKIDLKDRKILYQFDINSRRSVNQIAKRVGIPKSVISYRIKKLKDKEIIQNFYTVINPSKLGYIVPRFHFSFQYVTPKIEKEITDFFIKNKFTSIIGTGEGSWNLSVTFWIKDMSDFFLIWQEIQKKYGHFFKEQNLSYFINEIHFRPTYLLINEYEKSERDKIQIIRNDKPIEITDIDMEILRLISSNARIPLKEIGKKINLTSEATNYRIKQLIKKRIIIAFRTNYNINKIGYQLFRVYIYLRFYNQREKIINYIKYNSYLAYADTTIGESQLELEFHLKNTNQLHCIMQNITTKFPNVIKYYDYTTLMKSHKYLMFPDSY